MRTENHNPELASLVPLTIALERSFDLFNGKFFNGELEKPTITIAQGAKERAYGWVTIGYVWHKTVAETPDETQNYRELNISSDSLNRPWQEVACTLLHEMVHIFNSMADIQDCARNNLYHNAKFAKACNDHGMEAFKGEDYKKAGWRARFTPETLAWVEENLHQLADEVNIFRDVAGAKTKAAKKPLKYVCPVCGQSVRATKKVNIRCEDCNATMRLESGGDDDENDEESDD